MFDTSPSGIASLISQGESPSVEFKKYPVIPTRTLGQLLKFRDMQGGIVLFGVRGDGQIDGLTDRDEEVFARNINRNARYILSPDSFRSGIVDIEGKRVAFLEVFPSHSSVFGAVGPRVLRFLIESSLILSVYTGVWYLSWMSAAFSSGSIWHFVRGLYPPFSLTAVLYTDLTLFGFFGLVFYGTTYDVTPLRIVTALFWPVVRLYHGRSQRIAEVGRANFELAESTRDSSGAGDEHAETVESEVEPDRLEPEPDERETEGVQPDDLLRNIGIRASDLANRMERRTNTFMILGVFIGFSGLLFWYWTFKNTFPKPVGVLEFIEAAIPRVTILLFIELLAGFCLRQYRIGVEDFKYFFEIEEKASWKRVSYSILRNSNNNAGLLKLAGALAIEAGITKLKAGETTPTLETLKAEGNIGLEAMKLMSGAVREVVQVSKRKKT
jgi:hypothetical protein